MGTGADVYKVLEWVKTNTKKNDNGDILCQLLKSVIKNILDLKTQLFVKVISIRATS